MDVIYGHAAVVCTFGHTQKMYMDNYFFHWLIWPCDERKKFAVDQTGLTETHCFRTYYHQRSDKRWYSV